MCPLLVVVTARSLLAQVRSVGQLDAGGTPHLELAVLRHLARAFVVRNRKRPLAVRRSTERMPGVGPEIERRRVRHDLRTERSPVSPAADSKQHGRIPGCPK